MTLAAPGCMLRACTVLRNGMAWLHHAGHASRALPVHAPPLRRGRTWSSLVHASTGPDGQPLSAGVLARRLYELDSRVKSMQKVRRAAHARVGSRAQRAHDLTCNGASQIVDLPLKSAKLAGAPCCAPPLAAAGCCASLTPAARYADLEQRCLANGLWDSPHEAQKLMQARRVLLPRTRAPPVR